jgi:hypothetical protein
MENIGGCLIIGAIWLPLPQLPSVQKILPRDIRGGYSRAGAGLNSCTDYSVTETGE